MQNNIANSVYGQRFLVSSKLCLREIPNSGWILPQFEISRSMDIDFLSTNIADLIKSNRCQVTVLVDLDLSLETEELHQLVTLLLDTLGKFNISNFGLCIDEGSGAFEVLTQVDSLDNKQGLLVKTESVIELAMSRNFECCVAMCVEEIRPGGADPLDGIRLAEQLKECGISSIIVSCGSEHFPILKNRRQTKKKDTSQYLKLDWPEHFLASAQWLRDLGIPIFAQGNPADPIGTLKWAKKSGLAGVVDYRTNIHHPN